MRKGTLREKVAVIGAGIAGLAAARTLIGAGFAVTVLEARDRVGGRIHTDRSLGASLDFGAAWIHGTNNNPVGQLARRLNAVPFVVNYGELELFDADGRRLKDWELDQISLLANDLKQRIRKLKQRSGTSKSLGSALSRLIEDLDLPDPVARGLSWVMASALEIDSGAGLGDLSVFNPERSSDLQGSDAMLRDGLGQITDYLARGLEIKLDQRVRRIELGAGSVRVATDHAAFEVDRAVVTLPLGVLKSGAVEFSPELPSAKRDAIEGLGMGMLEKLALLFPRRFWPPRAQYMGYLGGTAEAALEFWNHARLTKEPILLALMRGPYARSLGEASEAENVEVAMADLRAMFGTLIPEPTGYLRTRWHSDPFALGASSNLPPGASPSDYDALAEPVEDRLFFAGEASNREHPATVHGAFLSGKNAAGEIVEASADASIF